MGCSICGARINPELAETQEKELGWTEGAVCGDHLLDKLKSMARKGLIDVDWQGIEKMMNSEEA